MDAMTRSDSAKAKQKAVADETSRLKTKTELLADLKSDDHRPNRIRRRISQVGDAITTTRHGRRIVARYHNENKVYVI